MKNREQNELKNRIEYLKSGGEACEHLYKKACDLMPLAIELDSLDDKLVALGIEYFINGIDNNKEIDDLNEKRYQIKKALFEVYC